MSELETLREAARIARDRDVTEGRRLVGADWLITTYGKRLHHATLTDDQYAHLIRWGPVDDRVRLACGRVVAWVAVPGVFERMGCQRCPGCCDATGLPRGKGSPKNDDACRAVLGL